MKKFISILVGCLIINLINISAQNSATLSQIASVKNGTDWIKFKPNIKIKAKDIFSNYNSLFGLRNSIDKMVLIKNETDKLNYLHLKYQQYYKDIPVEGAQYILHELNGKIETGNGKLITGLNIGTQPSISSNDAVNKALSFVNAEKYMWQDTETENLLKQIKNNPSATYYPKPELVIVDKKYGKDPSKYHLAYKMEVYATKPLQRLQIFVDAITGEIYHSIDILITTDKKGRASTLYNGTQSIMVDSVSASSYRLRETGRGKGIITLNSHNSTNHSAATDVTNTTLFFTTDKAANEAHWSAEKTYDFYLQKFGRNSYDDAGAPLYSYVHFGTNYINASWDGTGMNYGDGGSGYGPFTAIDVCGHEITHAVSGATAGFVYQDEPGALSESFSDMFGTAIEFFADSLPNWTIGEDVGPQPFRSLSNPKLYQQPSTYHGQYWNFTISDNGGVHQNNSIGNYWFYMLSVGDTGTNDNGYQYMVNGIGMDNAEKIAYRTLTYYLTSNSQYLDAYYASLQAAKDLFGNCSVAEKQTALAWYATGVGYPISNNDVFLLNVLSPVSACGLNNVSVSVNMYYGGCDSILHPGKKIVLAYKMDANALVYDTLVLSNNWKGGDSLAFTFKFPANVSTVGNHSLSCWAKLGENAPNFNDSIINYQFTNILQQNIDVGAIQALSPVSGCGLTNHEPVSFKFSFYGCNFIKAGDTIALSYKINSNTPVIEKYVLASPMYPHDTLSYTFKTLADLSNIFGTIQFQVRTLYAPDTFNLNDAVNFTVTHPKSLREDTITFDESNVNDLFFITTTKYSHASISAIAHHTGAKGFIMTGGNVLDYYTNLQFPDGLNTWQINDFLSAKISFCIDATSWKHANMRFDLRQTDGGATYAIFLGTRDYTKASNMRILANSTQIGGTYNPTTDTKDPWKTRYVNLDSYANSKFVLTFETRCLCKDTTYMGFPLTMDNVYIDNICFSELAQNSINDIEINKFCARLYPTPSTDWYSIDMESDGYQKIRFETFDLYGKLLKTDNQIAYTGKNKFVFNSTALSKGIYLIRLTGKTNTLTLRMVKQ